MKSVGLSCRLQSTASVVVSGVALPIGRMFGFDAAGLPWTAHHEIGT
jgi:hypothetical protein